MGGELMNTGGRASFQPPPTASGASEQHSGSVNQSKTSLVGSRAGMSQRSRPAYLDDGADKDGDVLNRSWDVESRYRLQENALRLPEGDREKTSAALFRVQVELGLHELTAAMSSLR